MSRKRDTNWSRDEITVLLDSIMEITKTRAEDGQKTNSKEVFEFAANKLGEKGHPSRAEREKCRTKWKKMKEEFTHAKKAREGDSRYKEAPGIQPFYDRMEEFINGTFDNISPHSTIVRRTSSLSIPNKLAPGMRASARLAANTNGTSNDNNDTSSTIVTRTNTSNEYPSTMHTPSDASTSPRQNSRLSSGSTNININMPQATTTTAAATIPNSHQHPPAISNGELCSMYTSYNNNSTAASTTLPNGTSDPIHIQSTEHADISYRVSTGCRQITIFGDHDVDIKFRGDCVTINKIDIDYPAAAET